MTSEKEVVKKIITEYPTIKYEDFKWNRAAGGYVEEIYLFDRKLTKFLSYLVVSQNYIL